VKIQTMEEGGITVVSVAGKIDVMTAPAFESALKDLIGRGRLRLALDFGEVGYISSAGLRVILLSAKTLNGKKGALLLVNPRGPVKEAFEISGFGSIFKIYDSVEAAVEAAVS
jgi:anti-sigma B factor antagonist